MSHYSDDQIRDLLRAAEVDRDALDQAEQVMLAQDQRILDLERCVAMLEAHNAELDRDLGLARSDLDAWRIISQHREHHLQKGQERIRQLEHDLAAFRENLAIRDRLLAKLPTYDQWTADPANHATQAECDDANADADRRRMQP